MARRLATTGVATPARAGDFGAFEVSRPLAAGDEIFAAGRTGAAPLILLGGAAGEVRKLSGGRRQILRLRLPGDLLYACAHEAVVALSRARVLDARPFLAFMDRPGQPPSTRRAWLALAQADQDLMRDQLVRLGRMTATERMAHLLLEIHDRLGRVGLTDDDTFHLPATQEVVSDLVGLSVVHLSRTLNALRRDALIRLGRGGVVEILDRPRLEDSCGWRRVAGPDPAVVRAAPAAVAADA